MDIEWPSIDEDEQEQVTEESVENDAFQSNCFKMEKGKDGGADVYVKVHAEVSLTPGMLRELMSSPNFTEELAESILQRILVEMNVSLLPVMRYKIEAFKNKKLLIH